MKKIVLLITLTILLFADNPNVYSSLGDKIYTNISSIENIKKIEKLNHFSTQIDKYIQDVESAKELGYLIESGKSEELAPDYLSQLRKLSKMDEFFVRTAYSNLDTAIKSKDNNLFIGIVNSGLIDVKENKKKILDYYKSNAKDINSTGIIQDMIDDERTKSVKKKKSYYKSKKQLEADRIQRIRESDRYEQEMLEKKLQEELEMKKKQIREEQERELFN